MMICKREGTYPPFSDSKIHAVIRGVLVVHPFDDRGQGDQFHTAAFRAGGFKAAARLLDAG